MKLECRAGETRITDGIFRVVGGKTRTTRLQRRGGRANSRKSTRTFKRCCIYTANTRHCAAGAYGTCFPTKGLTFSCAKRKKSACWWCSATLGAGSGACDSYRRYSGARRRQSVAIVWRRGGGAGRQGNSRSRAGAVTFDFRAELKNHNVSCRVQLLAASGTVSATECVPAS